MTLPVQTYRDKRLEKLPNILDINYDEHRNIVGNGIIKINTQYSHRPNIVYKSNNAPIRVRTLYSDKVCELDARHLGQPWNDSKNVFAPRYTENWNFDGYIYYPLGEDVIVVPLVNLFLLHFRFMMPLVRDENGIHVQQYGLPLGNGEYTNPRYTDGDNFAIERGIITLGRNIPFNGRAKYAKVASNRYANISGACGSDVIGRVVKYYSRQQTK